MRDTLLTLTAAALILWGCATSTFPRPEPAVYLRLSPDCRLRLIVPSNLSTEEILAEFDRPLIDAVVMPGSDCSAYVTPRPTAE